MLKKKIAIIGGGPNSIYATEILLKKILNNKYKKKLRIIFFDKYGNFGFGNTHNIKLDKKILLNRIAHQISLGSNPFIKFPNKLKTFDYNFMEWVKKKKLNNILKESWPPRSIFGLALKDKFYDLIKIFQKYTNVEVELIYDKVISISRSKKTFYLSTSNKKIECTNLLVATGNYNTSDKMNSLSRKIYKITKNTSCKFYYNFLDLLPNKDFWKSFKQKNVIVYGTGTTSIDIITMLNKNNNHIYSISRSSLFPFSRAFNQKIDNPKKKEHKPIFLDDELIYYLKNNINNKDLLNVINFEEFIHPFIKIEFYYVYFQNFMNQTRLKKIKNKLKKEMLRIKITKNYNYKILVDIFDEFILDLIKNDTINKKFYNSNWFANKKFLRKISKKEVNFYDLFVNPLRLINNNEFIKEYPKFLNWDIKQAKLGNMDSPFKNACDGVWRDIRQQYTKLFDNCNNLLIYDYFLKNILSIHNKLCDGPSVDSIARIKNLILNKKITILKKNSFEIIKKDKNVYLYKDKKKVLINQLYYGIADLYKRDYTKDKLISSMKKNNLISFNQMKFKNKNYILGLNLNKNQNPVVKKQVYKNIRFVGPASEGRKFFHHTLSRPDKKQFNMTDLIDWADSVI